MRWHPSNSDSARRVLCAAGIVGFVTLALCSEANKLTRFHIMHTAPAEDSLIGAFHPRTLTADAASPGGFYSLLGDEGAMPDLDDAVGWLNSAPLSRKSLRGRAVLVNFLDIHLHQLSAALAVFSTPVRLSLYHWGLSGSWNVNAESAVLEVVPGKIVFRFHSRDLNLVAAPAREGEPVRFGVRLDGALPGENCGVDTVPDGSGEIRSPDSISSSGKKVQS